MAEAVMVARSLRKSYFRQGRDSAGSIDAVAGVGLELASGELCALMGRSGSGKSTLIGMLAGLLAPTQGTVLLEGRDLYACGDAMLSRLRNERIGVVPQGQTPIHSLTVLDNVTLPCGLYRHDESAGEGALALLDRLDMSALAWAYPRELSGGELRRMAIARALVTGPAVVLADEPTADLDDRSTALVLDVLQEAARGGAAVLVATHDAACAERADRTLRMDAGRLVA